MQPTQEPVPAQFFVNRASRTRLRISYSLLALLVLIDQLLLPMLRLGSVSFKVSYFALGLWLLDWIVRSRKTLDARRDINRIFAVFGIILGCILVGELWLAASYSVPSYYEAVRGMLTFGFAALAFGLGRSSARFKLEWLVPILLGAIILNFMFIIFKNDLPSWLITSYYPERTTIDVVGVDTVEDILALVQPRGLFGNPNASMLMVNIVVLFVHLGIRNQVLTIKSGTTAAAIVVLPVILSVSLGSRGEFLVALMLAFLNYGVLARSHGRAIRRSFTATFVLIVSALSLIVVRYGDDLQFAENIGRIYKIMDFVADTDPEGEEASAVERPLIAFELFQGRFSQSPLFGTGISAAAGKQLDEGTQYFHNDWFHILTVAGLLGTLSLAWMLRLFVMRLGWPVFTPFVLPGLVNTFMLNIPAFIAYFALVGVCFAALSQKSSLGK